MIGPSLAILRTSKGRFKGYAWGAPNGHCSDWRGSNYHIRSIDGQPLMGYATAEECEAFIRAKFTDDEALREWARRGDGAFMKGDVLRREVKSLTLPRRAKPVAPAAAPAPATAAADPHMVKYCVPIVYKGQSNYVVEATNPDEAREKATQAYYGGEPGSQLGNEWEEIDHVGVIEEVPANPQGRRRS